MIAVFVGPSLAGIPIPNVVRHGPARLGDITKAVLQGATKIGLIDGVFEDCAAVWHKEILFALSMGVPVYGAASMGALRAAECHPFGMVGVGRIFRLYATGRIEDDDAVAQLHAPADLDYVPLTIALVDIRATLLRARRARELSNIEARKLWRAAQDVFFKDRTFQNIIVASGIEPAARRSQILDLIKDWRYDLKRGDAQELVTLLAEVDCDLQPIPKWDLARTYMFQAVIDRSMPK